jgi:hypothetical protein
MSTAVDASDDSVGLGLRLIVWICQLVGALPYRDEPLPLVLYAVTILLWAAISVLALRRTTAALRRAASAVAVVSLVIPVGFAVATGHGDLWQGRYGWPLAMGYFLLLGIALERRDPGPAPLHHRLVVWTGVAVSAVVMAAPLVHVVGTEQVHNPLAGDPSWWTLPNGVLVSLAFATFALLGVAITPRRPGPAPSASPGASFDESDHLTPAK